MITPSRGSSNGQIATQFDFGAPIKLWGLERWKTDQNAAEAKILKLLASKL